MGLTTITSFNSKVLLIWSGVGSAVALITGIIGLVPGNWNEGSLLTLLQLTLLGAFAYNVYGFFILLLVAGTQYKFKFSAVRHPVWYWAIYPILGMTLLFIGIILGIMKSAFKGS
jgi:hypothetical protein